MKRITVVLPESGEFLIAISDEVADDFRKLPNIFHTQNDLRNAVIRGKTPMGLVDGIDLPRDDSDLKDRFQKLSIKDRHFLRNFLRSAKGYGEILEKNLP